MCQNKESKDRSKHTLLIDCQQRYQSILTERIITLKYLKLKYSLKNNWTASYSIWFSPIKKIQPNWQNGMGDPTKLTR